MEASFSHPRFTIPIASRTPCPNRTPSLLYQALVLSAGQPYISPVRLCLPSLASPLPYTSLSPYFVLTSCSQSPSFAQPHPDTDYLVLSHPLTLGSIHGSDGKSEFLKNGICQHFDLHKKYDHLNV